MADQFHERYREQREDNEHLVAENERLTAENELLEIQVEDAMDTVSQMQSSANARPTTDAASPDTGRSRSVSISAPRGATADPRVRSTSPEPKRRVDSLLSDFDKSIKELAVRRG